MPEQRSHRRVPTRRILALLLLLPTLTGCVDSLGIGSDCAIEMQAVRRDEGRGPDDSRRDEFRGSYTELWTYLSVRRTYTFRWGAGYTGCEVDGPNRFSRIPEQPPVF